MESQRNNQSSIINHYSNNCWIVCGGSNSTNATTDNDGNLKKQEVYIPDSPGSFISEGFRVDFPFKHNYNFPTWRLPILLPTTKSLIRHTSTLRRILIGWQL